MRIRISMRIRIPGVISVICIAETYEIGQLGESKQLQTCEREITNSFKADFSEHSATINPNDCVFSSIIFDQR
jgi:hypothetical protein